MARVPGTCSLTLLASVLLSAGLAAAYREMPVTNGARIVGTVSVAGNVSPLPPQPVYKEKEFCGTDVPDERLLVDPAGHLGSAVVHLRLSRSENRRLWREGLHASAV